jgi:hypothetical protein
MKYQIRLIGILGLVLLVFSTSNSKAKSKEQIQDLNLDCEAKSIFYSYPDNISFIKDLHSHSRELYSEKFRIEFSSPDRAIKKHSNDIVADEEYSVTKVGSVYKLKFIKGTDDISAVIDLPNKKYSSISEKSDALIRIKATGTCIQQH